jgi:hypothetical protein
MVGPKQEAHHMRYEQADVAYGAANGDSQAGEDRGGDVNDQADAADVNPKVHSFFFAGEEQIEIGSGGVDGGCGSEKSYAENPAQALLQRR